MLSITYTLNIGSEGCSAYYVLNELAKNTDHETFIITNSVAHGTDISNFQFIKELRLNTNRLYWQAWFKICAFSLSLIYTKCHHIGLIQQVLSDPFVPFFTPFRRALFVWLFAMKADPSFTPPNLAMDDNDLLIFGELPNKLRKPHMSKNFIGNIGNFFKRRLATHFVNGLQRIITFLTTKNLSLVVAGTPYSFEFCKKIVSQRKVVFLPEAIDLSKFKYSQPPHNKILLTLAAMFAHEGIEVAIRAMKEITYAEPDAMLNVLGDGPQMNNLKGLVEELGLTGNVQFHGYVANEEVPSFFEQSRIVLLPAYVKSGGMTIKEAMAVGRPVVATKAEGHLDSIEEGHDGFLVDLGDYKEMAKASIRLLRDYDLCIQMSINAHAKATQMYNASSTAKKLAELYSILVRNNPHGINTLKDNGKKGSP